LALLLDEDGAETLTRLALSGARPRLILTVGIEEGANDLRNEHPGVQGVAMNLLVVPRVTLEARVEFASEHDAHLN
jgi:hypothetical protein